ncbi:hypothetical protein MJO28_006881 [Puccinia striiformis f. sp. tritici]|uniref:Adenylate kinase isoenzyme 6 homolog n=3 Tax=Puccinia striiformis TaxID=27350 RepID=A0A0L0UZF1_9BASI|nr:hypothetical protein Pst134EA_013009 [Puccinia striiformis f. sp. tritici]KAI9630391.1 hypothetical protein KEM48_014117 [Puccinia striiformis f. sp. tritici PST-130]KNE92400.1 hypothetical protein PSTG_14236 [Puccinia striiformis f. sp. tritici PST-78]POW13778.1 hypothetical protein PSTT_03411 [Puccinia striiformis]KAH9453891.1 hypothetical protein Pst134EB_013993 [Puccinia striiformis f. sp. tritici]KAH9465113.1 hypothetical protein Pst134EA_013009 [Puccinia striiformis f. sp. tritici]
MATSDQEISCRRKNPNILITGTPGTGKTTHAEMLAQESNGSLQAINVGDFVKEHGCHEGWDDEWQSWLVDDEKLLDELEPIMSCAEGGKIIDWHSCEIFPERWIDLVIVLRTTHTILWDRLEKRKYSLKKIQENNEAEIMGECLEEARENYDEEIVIELESETIDAIDSNIHRILAWIDHWKNDNQDSS